MKIEITITFLLLASCAAATHVFTTRPADALVAAKSPHLSTEQRQAVSVYQGQAQQSLEHRLASRPDGLEPPPNDSTNHNRLIVDAAYALSQSPPLKARLRYKINLFGEEISGPGKYFQKGQGTRLSRMQFEFGFNQSSVQIHQFCDGNLLYTLSAAGNQTNLEFVDLRKLDELQGQVSSSSRVKNWLSVGSLTGLMEQLASHFEFIQAERSSLDTIPVIVVTGRWKASALARLLEGQPHANAIGDGQINWSGLPAHLPHTVSLTLGMDQKFPYFPYRIVFKRFVPQDGQWVGTDAAVLELFELQQAIDLTDDMFSIPGLETPPVDSTEFYRKRIQQFSR